MRVGKNISVRALRVKRWSRRCRRSASAGLALGLGVVLALLSGCGGTRYGDADGPGDGIPQTADAIPRAEPKSRYGNLRSYVVRGKRYYTMDSSDGFVQRGIASWYGRKFHGRRTSSGETYDMYAMTAAHKALPLPTYVRVTHLGNGKSIVVKVNDRGPFHQNRIIDLSYAAALRLGIVRNGTAPVQVEALRPGGGASRARGPAAPAPRQVASPAGPSAGSNRAPAGGRAVRDRSTVAPAPQVLRAARPSPVGTVHLYLQLGAFSNLHNAQSLVARVGTVLNGEPRISEAEVRGQVVYRVRMGPYQTTAQIDRVAARLSSAGFSDSVVVVERGRGGG